MSLEQSDDDFVPLTGAREIATACRWFKSDGTPDVQRVYYEHSKGRLPARQDGRILRSTLGAIKAAFTPTAA